MSKLIIVFFVCMSLPAFSTDLKEDMEEGGRRRSSSAPPEQVRIKNVLKLNVSPLLFSTLSATYEFNFYKNMSASLRYGYMFQRGLPIKFKDDNRTDPVIQGYSISPEFRFYQGNEKKSNSPQGFYLGLNIKHSEYFITWTRYTPHHLENRIVYSATTLSGFAGYQWLTKKHLSVDLCFAGLGFGLARLSGGFSAPDVDLSIADQEIITREYRKALDQGLAKLLGFSGMQIETTDNSLRMAVRNIPAYSLRLLGLSIGYSF